jgi:hypothetical protein
MMLSKCSKKKNRKDAEAQRRKLPGREEDVFAS